jgi:hypothetical protein
MQPPMRPIANISALPHANAKQPSKHFSTQIESVSQLHTDQIEILFTGSILSSDEVAENSVHAAAYMRPIANISALPHANAKQPSKHFSTQIESVSLLHTDQIEFLFTGSILSSELRSEVAENSVHAAAYMRPIANIRPSPSPTPTPNNPANIFLLKSSLFHYCTLIKSNFCSRVQYFTRN